MKEKSIHPFKKLPCYVPIQNGLEEMNHLKYSSYLILHQLGVWKWVHSQRNGLIWCLWNMKQYWINISLLNSSLWIIWRYKNGIIRISFNILFICILLLFLGKLSWLKRIRKFKYMLFNKWLFTYIYNTVHID